MQLLNVKSISRDLPLIRYSRLGPSLGQRLYNLSPAPLAINIASSLFIADLFLPFEDPVNKNRETTPMISNDGY